MPDSGHVLPLLRIAQTFVNNQHEVICYLPDECRNYADSFQLQMRSLGKVTEGVADDVFTRIAKMSFLYYRKFGYKVLSKGYFGPIKSKIEDQLQNIKEMIKKDNLSFIISDNHVPLFNEWYISTAQYVNVPIALHHSEGTYRYLQENLVSVFGFQIPLIMRIGKFVLYRLIIRFIQRIASLRRKDSEQRDIESVSSDYKDVIYFTSGIALVEKEVIDLNKLSQSKQFMHFPPVVDKRASQIKDDLKQWLDHSEGKPVVYISFGSILRPDMRILRAILNGLTALNVRILWVASKEEKVVLESICRPPNLLVEEFVPQPKVLLHENIRCFITHGGAGSIQESLLAGKPMLCIPFVNDQPYNSSIISLLNAGIRLDKNKVTGKSVQKSVNELLNNPRYRDSAQRIMEILSKNEGGEAIFNYLYEKVLTNH